MSSTVSQEEPETPSDVALLRPALWQRLLNSTTTAELAEAWLNLQIQQIDGADGGIVLLRRDSGFAPLALSAATEAQVEPLRRAAEEAAQRQAGLVKGRSDRFLAYPVALDGEPVGAVAVHVGNATDEQVRLRLRHLQWGIGWLRDRLRAEALLRNANRLEQTQTALALQATALVAEGFSAACRAVATDLARRLDAERVAIGIRRLGRSRVQAISHSAGFGKKTSLVRALAGAMDEALDQNSAILVPAPSDGPALAARAHGELQKISGAPYVLTVPLIAEDRLYGAVTVERGEATPLTQRELDLLDGALALLGPVLRIKQLEDRWLIRKGADALAAHALRLFGPGHWKRKLALAGAAAAGVFFWFAYAPYTVPADARLEGSVQRAVVAQLDGYIREAPFSAGDLVAEGDLMVAFDDRELVLERLRWTTERQRQQIEYERALAERDRAAAQVAQTQMAQSDAQIRLVDESIARSSLHAPFAGIVVSGDLSQRIGSSANRGEVLFEVAPENDYRVVLMIEERRIDEVHVGQSGSLVLTALPEDVFAIAVTKITPIAMPVDGRNAFRVEASLAQDAPALRPGMEGVAKIGIDEERLIWIWTRPMIDWARIALWRWMPGL
ncbi:efflux RND transporter periplasmic adaptor subunit [Thetidibacter halocola]|uniref:Efflux RND transporter periplasmic adaptor subunit n=1 Tax=Thetidibacter halocola TaxID=2827239 RepID=A0A8J8B912_9RHOB|nr:efflux RND transporter periplasmic adaptor subunit [Thetidibacter halocola]MBS0126826.1 efflux RND transporter periplasmic adaptor subunit [Thetidibacter halocola]